MRVGLAAVFVALAAWAGAPEQPALAAEHALAHAWDAKDLATLEKMIAADFSGTTASGKTIDKRALLDFIGRSPAGKPARYEDERIWVNGNVAVYTAKVIDTVDENGTSHEEVSRVTDVLEHDKSGWVLKFSHETAVVKPAAPAR
ncbi:MAG: nuclear transport factor 2 family protein [Myxococcaceae bacterium]